ncbi:PaaI family thioesterase [Neorhizobium sp. LjRoot104]|uniref:PaaI family thioesterase n=1 Tax=Neorhizobium sp. LjRoot104 TaxID=3342254 RepID=UPI003ECC2A1B
MTTPKAPIAEQTMVHDEGFTHDPPPAARLLGWRLEHFDPEAQILRCSFHIGEQFLNPAGVVQGGILAACSMRPWGRSPPSSAEAHLFADAGNKGLASVPAPRGRIIPEAQFVKMGRNFGFMEGRLTLPGGEVLAIATTMTRLFPQDRS